MFKDKVLVVTGGASGIGLGVCRKFGRAGAKIAMIDVDDTALENAKNEFKKKQIPFLGLQCDVTDQQAVFQTMEQIIRHFNQIDILFNNAGITQRGLFSKTRIDVMKRVMDVNFFGSLYCTKAALDSLINQKGAIIEHFVSVNQ